MLCLAPAGNAEGGLLRGPWFCCVDVLLAAPPYPGCRSQESDGARYPSIVRVQVVSCQIWAFLTRVNKQGLTGHGCSHDRDLLMILQGFLEISTHSRQTGSKTRIALWSRTGRSSRLLGSLCGQAGSIATATELKAMHLHVKGPLTWNWCHRGKDNGRPGDGSRQLLWILQQGCGWGFGLMA